MSKDLNKNNKFNKKSTNQYYAKINKHKSNNNQKIVCWNCKRPGHKSTVCKMKKKINDIFSKSTRYTRKIN